MTDSPRTAAALAAWGVGPVDPPAAVREAALRHLLDGVGTALGAVRTRAAGPALRVATDLGGPPEAVVLGGRQAVSAPAAALATGTLVHALDFDDTHAGGLVHATSVVAPAALAVGQQVGASGAEVVTAAVVGYETVCRVAAAAPHGFHRRGLHATMVAGVFSSALVTARLLGLDAARATHALGIAGSCAGGLLAFLGTGASTKQLHPGLASQSGILAARLAAAGATGPDTVLDGPHGIYDALADGPADPGSVLRGLGRDWETTRIGIKPHPACQLSHATLDAVSDALRRAGAAPGDVGAVHAVVHPDSASVVCSADRDLTRPASPYAAKFSLPWSVAALVLDGRLDVDTFAPGSIARPEVQALAARVSWEPTSSSRGPAADAPGDVVLTLRDGRTVAGHVDRSAGGGAFPLSREALLAKVAGNVGGPATELVAAVEALDRAPGLDRLLDLAAQAAEPYRELEAARA